jgi:chromosome segregation ATPase
MSDDTTNENNSDSQEAAKIVALQSRVDELEGVINGRDKELTDTRAKATELQNKLSVLEKKATESVEGYRKLVIETNKNVTEDMVKGDDIAAINKSLKKANELIGKLKLQIEKDVEHSRVPIGSPGRREQDLFSMSPREKINYAIGGKK